MSVRIQEVQLRPGGGLAAQANIYSRVVDIEDDALFPPGATEVAGDTPLADWEVVAAVEGTQRIKQTSNTPRGAMYSGIAFYKIMDIGAGEPLPPNSIVVDGATPLTSDWTLS